MKLIKWFLELILCISGILGFAMIILGGLGGIPTWMFWGMVLISLSVFIDIKVPQGVQK